MESATIVALANALDKQAKPLKKNLVVGTHEIDEIVTVRVKGTVTKGASVMYTPTADMPILAVLAIFIEKSGIVGDNISRMLGEAMQEAIEFGKDRKNEDGEALPDLTSREAIENRLKDIDSVMARVRKLTNGFIKKSKEGSTRCKVTVEEATFQPVKKAA